MEPARSRPRPDEPSARTRRPRPDERRGGRGRPGDDEARLRGPGDEEHETAVVGRAAKTGNASAPLSQNRAELKEPWMPQGATMELTRSR